MRFTLPLVLTVLAGCGVVTSAGDVPPLSVATATALAVRDYERCSDWQTIGQCGLLEPFADEADTTLAVGMTPYVRLVRVRPDPNAATAALDAPDRIEPIATKLASQYAMHGIHQFTDGPSLPIGAGESLDDAIWRVEDVHLRVLSFSQKQDAATLHAALELVPTPLESVMRSQHYDLATPPHQLQSQGHTVTIHLRYDYQSGSGVLQWEVAR